MSRARAQLGECGGRVFRGSHRAHSPNRAPPPSPTTAQVSAHTWGGRLSGKPPTREFSL